MSLEERLVDSEGMRERGTEAEERERRRRVDEQIAEALEEDSSEALSLLDVDTFHLGGQHSQKSHGRGGSSGVSGDAESVREGALDRLDTARDARDRLEGSDAEREARRDMLDAHAAYVGGERGYQNMNGALRGNTDLSSSERAQALERVGHLDRAFDDLGVSNDEPITVYRGLSDVPPSLRDQLGTRGAVITDDGFMSTTTDLETAEDFAQNPGDALLQIRVPAGRTSIAGANHESEMIYSRGSSIEVLGVDRDMGIVTARMV